MRKYREILREYRASILLSPFLVLASVISETIQPYFMAVIVDEGIAAGDLQVIKETGGCMLAAVILGLIAGSCNMYVSSKVSAGFGAGLRSSLFHKIQQLAFADIDKFSSGSLVTRLTNDVARVQQVVMMSMRILLRAPMLMALAVFFIIRINAGLAFIMAAAIPVLGITIWMILHKSYPYFLKVQQQIDHLNNMVRENLINIRVVKSFVREGFEADKFAGSSESLRDIVIRASNLVVTIFPAMQLVTNLSILAILWFGGVRVMDNSLKVGELISFVNYLMQILMSMMMLSMVIMTIARASASSGRIIEVLETNPSLKETEDPAASSNVITRGEVVFDGVSFRYGGGETDVLRNITFTACPGETVAVVGSTGSAKSSMVQLIPRLYDVAGGELLIDGVNVKDYPLDELHCKIGMVLQKNELFSGTVRDNLLWGNPSASQEDMEEAARVAEAHGFITSFTDGYDTILGRGGMNVSGGQKQRICIARALLSKPKILILDDSTSAVDSETELKIRENLNRMAENTTVFIVTQRIRTMQSADRVIILDDGEINATGTPQELFDSSEIYREIYYSQQVNLA